MSKFVLGVLAFLFSFLLTLLTLPNDSYAVPICGGTITCHQILQQCVGPDGSCECGSQDCGPPFAYCAGTPPLTESCGSFSQSQCTDSNFHLTYCNTGCAQTGALISASCTWLPDACTGDAGCPAYPNQRCCGGTPNYCSTPGFACNGTPLTTPTPVPPTPTPACTPNSFISGTFCLTQTTCYDIYCNAQGTGTENRNYSGSPACTHCASATATPTQPAAPTATPGGGACGGGGIQCPPSGACWDACCTCDGPFANCSACPPACSPNGSPEGAGGCCSGYSSGGICQNPPSCSGCQSWNGSACQDNNALCGGGQVCIGGVCQAQTFTISGTVFIDTNGNGVQNCSGACNNGPGDELGYNNATITRTGPGVNNTTTNTNGGYSFTGLQAATYQINLSVPSGYSTTSTNPRSVIVGPNQTSINFALSASAPSCTGGLLINPGSVNPGGTATLSVSTCTNVENPDNGSPPPPFAWNPDTNGNTPPPTLGTPNNTPTSSTVVWTAPACPTVQTTYSPQVVVGGPGGTTSYQGSITVPATYGITANVREVSDLSSCTASSGTAYQGAVLNVTGPSTNQNQTTNASGQASFACLANGTYTLSLQVPSGYEVVGRAITPGAYTSIGTNGIQIALAQDRTATFCIAVLDPWYQTTIGDVRFRSINNPIPSGLYGSTDPDYPGIYYSSDTNADFGGGLPSQRGWRVNDEYDYNANSQNSNGNTSYSFYKSKARQEGITITDISSGTFDESEITGTGLFEADGDLLINTYNHFPGRRVVLLVNGDVTINTEIDIPVGGGVFIIASNGNINIAPTVGTATLSSTATQLDGIYTAEGSIILEGSGCSAGSPDERLNIGGNLIANSLKPFSTSGTGSIQNNRSLCAQSLLYPTLYVSLRPDFLTNLTDFYKSSYTKWREVRP